MAKAENNIFKEIRLAVSTGCSRLFRNNVGMVKDQQGRMHRFGLCKGSSDGIGWHSMIVTPDMVGKPVAVFLAIEAKTATGRVSKEQQNFIDRVEEAGGIAGVARSAEDALKLLDMSRNRG